MLKHHTLTRTHLLLEHVPIISSESVPVRQDMSLFPLALPPALVQRQKCKFSQVSNWPEFSWSGDLKWLPFYLNLMSSAREYLITLVRLLPFFYLELKVLELKVLHSDQCDLIGPWKTFYSGRADNLSSCGVSLVLHEYQSVDDSSIILVHPSPCCHIMTQAATYSSLFRYLPWAMPLCTWMVGAVTFIPLIVSAACDTWTHYRLFIC